MTVTMRNDANRLTPEQLERFAKWVADLLGPDDAPIRSQQDVATLTGKSQGFISNIKRGVNTTRGTALQMLQKAGGDVYAVLGDGPAVAGNKYRERDHMHARGFALDALSLVYEEDFCDAILMQTPPHGSDSWTTDAWVDYIVAMRKLWQSGHLKAKPLPVRRER